MKTMIVCLLLCSAAFAQDAKVVELSQADATQAKQLYQAKIAADKAWDDFNAKLRESHQEIGQIEFSKDFRFIVPKPYTPPNTWGSCITLGSASCPTCTGVTITD
jgi:hypothetical protein